LLAREQRPRYRKCKTEFEISDLKFERQTLATGVGARRMPHHVPEIPEAGASGLG
jgi:hypothetical protein